MIIFSRQKKSSNETFKKGEMTSTVSVVHIRYLFLQNFVPQISMSLLPLTDIFCIYLCHSNDIVIYLLWRAQFTELHIKDDITMGPGGFDVS